MNNIVEQKDRMKAAIEAVIKISIVGNNERKEIIDLLRGYTYGGQEELDKANVRYFALNRFKDSAYQNIAAIVQDGLLAIIEQACLRINPTGQEKKTLCENILSTSGLVLTY